jgi:imidazole glycerol-phosphate synthase subunit HisH
VTRVAILDYGMGNLRSVEKALEHVGATPERTDDHDRVRAADAIVLPGVGAFRKAMERVRERGFDELLHERVDAGVPVIGLCLGMQLLFDSSTELGGATGLGLLPGEVRELETGGLKVPQIGWNRVEWRGHSPLTRDLPPLTPMYHVHSYAAHPERAEDVLGTAHYGKEFVTAVTHGNVYGVQFHPEKSCAHGLKLLANFSSAVPAAA